MLLKRCQAFNNTVFFVLFSPRSDPFLNSIIVGMIKSKGPSLRSSHPLIFTRMIFTGHSLCFNRGNYGILWDIGL